METDKKRGGRGHLKRWMQALALGYVLMFLPVHGFREAESAGAGGGSLYTGADTDCSPAGGTEEKGEQQKPRIALTFDDGPSAVYTPMLLDGLKERGVRATFFLVGENIVKDGNQRIVRRMYDEGHLLGNHTYHHVDLSALSKEEAHEELAMTDALIREITGRETEIVRPPFGAFPDRMEEELDKLYVKWTVDSRDWVTKNTQEIVRKVVTDTKENDIILMHDCYGTSVEAALQIIDALQERGYEFVTADQLLMK